MITTINEFKIFENNITSKNVDIKKLENYGTALKIICNYEYGDLYFNPETDSIFVCLGDANPFDIETLTWFIKDYVSIDYKTSDNIKIEIEMECMPTENGWMLWNGKKWINHEITI